jgi:hypothetical protein
MGVTMATSFDDSPMNKIVPLEAALETGKGDASTSEMTPNPIPFVLAPSDFIP